MRTQRVEERKKARFHHVVVVSTAGIAGNGQTARPTVGVKGIGVVIVERDGHNGAHALDQQARIAAFLLIACQIAHFAVTTLGEPTLTARNMCGVHGFGGRKSTGKKAEAAGLGFDVRVSNTIIGHCEWFLGEFGEKAPAFRLKTAVFAAKAADFPTQGRKRSADFRRARSCSLECLSHFRLIEGLSRRAAYEMGDFTGDFLNRRP